MRSPIACSVFAAAALLQSSTALSQSTPSIDPTLRASRRDMIDRAGRERQRGNHIEALRLAESAQAILASPSLTLMIAQEQNALGRIAEAYGNSLQCESTAARDSGPDARTILRVCTDLSATLRPRLGFVNIHVVEPPAGLRVTVNGREIPQSLLDQNYAVSPGNVEVLITAPDHDDFRQTIASTATTTTPVQVRLTRRTTGSVVSDAGVTNSDAGTTTVISGSDAGAGGDASIGPPIVTVQTGPGAGPWILVGLGAALAGTGGAMYGLYSGAYAESQRGCDAEGCPPAVVMMNRPAYDRAVTFNALAIAGFAAGGALIVGGLVWFFVAPRTEQRPAPQGATAGRLRAPARSTASVDGVSIGPGSFFLRGSF